MKNPTIKPEAPFLATRHPTRLEKRRANGRICILGAINLDQFRKCFPVAFIRYAAAGFQFSIQQGPQEQEPPTPEATRLREELRIDTLGGFL